MRKEMEHGMKRVLVYGMTNNPGGIESYLLSILKKAKEYEIQLDFVTDFPRIVYEEILKEFGARIFYIPAKGKKLLNHWKGLKKILNENPNYDTVYFNILDAGAVFTMLIPWLMGKKIVVHSHNGNTDKMILHKICKPFLNIVADEYVACSELAAEFMFGKRKYEKEDVVIVPNAIDVRKYEYNLETRNYYRKMLGLEKKFVVCHVGRITRQKNPFRVIDIFNQVHLKEPKACLIYVGSGELEEEIKKYVCEKRLEDTVYFLGKRDDVAEIMQASDVFLLPSLYEGLPIVAIEAQAAGLPIVLSDNITKETDITGLVLFISLKEKDEKWANSIISYQGGERKSYKSIISEAGYDKTNSSESTKKLIDIL